MAALNTIYTQESEFWKNYVAGRPQLPDSFFDLIFDYHAKHGGQFEQANDIGSGPGIHSPRLANRFNKVRLTDIGESNIKIARERFGADKRYSFDNRSMEDALELPGQDIDLIFAATMMHYVDIDMAMVAIYHQLKTGGTFAAVDAAFAVLENAEVYDIWKKLFHRGLDTILVRVGGFENSTMDATMVKSISNLDYIPLPATRFTGVQRIHYNDPIGNQHRELCVKPEWKERFPHDSKIGPDDKIIMIEDKVALGFEASLEQLKVIYATFPADHEDAQIKELWGNMENVLKGGKAKGHWLVDLVLATKLEDPRSRKGR